MQYFCRFYVIIWLDRCSENRINTYTYQICRKSYYVVIFEASTRCYIICYYYCFIHRMQNLSIGYYKQIFYFIYCYILYFHPKLYSRTSKKQQTEQLRRTGFILFFKEKCTLFSYRKISSNEKKTIS